MKIFQKIALIALILSGLNACSKPKDCFSGRIDLSKCTEEKWYSTRPPGTVMIRENFFCDRSEVSNIDYREYLFWLKKVFGERSLRFGEALPDFAVWEGESFIMNSGLSAVEYGEKYFLHPAFDNFPVVGVRFEQVQHYAKWRSDRVLEMNLIVAGLISENRNQDSMQFFSIENYLRGGYLGVKPVANIPIPRYRLPTVSEWETAAAGGLDAKRFSLGIDPDSRRAVRFLKKKKQLFATADYLQDNLLSTAYFVATKQQDAFLENGFGLRHTIGNVAEMTAEKGIAKGGSWKHKLDDSRLDRQQTYQKPEAWLGFRMVCSWEMPLIIR